MMLPLRFGMVLRNMCGTIASFAFEGNMEAGNGNAAADQCAGHLPYERTCFVQM